MERHAAIIGAGVIGCAIARELRRRGFAVSVIDRNGDAGARLHLGVLRHRAALLLAARHDRDGPRGGLDLGRLAGYLGPLHEDLAVFRRPGVLFILPRVDETVRDLLADMRRLGVRATSSGN